MKSHKRVVASVAYVLLILPYSLKNIAQLAWFLVVRSFQATEHARCLLNSLIFIGFAISGMVEHGITVALHDLTPTKPAGAPEDNTRTSRRYCDPPNMTALAIYYDSSEETHINDEYDFSQLQEMFFQVGK